MLNSKKKMKEIKNNDKLNNLYGFFEKFKNIHIFVNENLDSVLKNYSKIFDSSNNLIEEIIFFSVKEISNKNIKFFVNNFLCLILFKDTIYPIINSLILEKINDLYLEKKIIIPVKSPKAELIEIKKKKNARIQKRIKKRRTKQKS